MRWGAVALSGFSLAMAGGCSAKSTTATDVITLRCEGQQTPPIRPVYFVVDFRGSEGSWSGEIEKGRPASLSFEEYPKAISVEWSDHTIKTVLEEQVISPKSQLEVTRKIDLQIARSDGRFRLVHASRMCQPTAEALKMIVEQQQSGLGQRPLPPPVCENITHWKTEGVCNRSSIPIPAQKF